MHLAVTCKADGVYNTVRLTVQPCNPGTIDGGQHGTAYHLTL